MFGSYSTLQDEDRIQYDDRSDHTGDHVVYSDRLVQWDYKKHNDLCKKHFGNEGQMWYNRHHEKVSDFLSDYNNRKVIVTKIKLTHNVSSGYPIWVFWYKDVE